SYRQAILDTAAHFGVTITGADIGAAKAKGGANNDWALTHRLVHEGKMGDDAAPTLEAVTAEFERRASGWCTWARWAPTPEAVTAEFERWYQGADTGPGLKALERLLPSKKVLLQLKEKCDPSAFRV
ncbi:hypothetical protein T484DRAFT_1865921, partial [Baffinella frigidus]